MFIERKQYNGSQYFKISDSFEEPVENLYKEMKKIKFLHPFKLEVIVSVGDRRKYRYILVDLFERFIYSPFFEGVFYSYNLEYPIPSEDYFNFENTFITKEKLKSYEIIGVKDNIDLPLELFTVELIELNLKDNPKIFVYLSKNDRIGYRRELIKLFNSINECSCYTLFFILKHKESI